MMHGRQLGSSSLAFDLVHSVDYVAELARLFKVTQSHIMTLLRLQRNDGSRGRFEEDAEQPRLSFLY